MSAAPAVSREAQLQWESRIGRLAAGAAFLSAALAAASTVVQVSIGGAQPDDRREALLRFDANRGDYMLSLGFQIASYFLLVGALFYLLRATMYRRAETPNWSISLLLLAPLLLAVGGLLSQIELHRVADDFLASPERTNERAKDLLGDQSVVGGALGYGGILCLALSFVLVSLNAMRAGLLSRFMGVLGIIVGVLLVLPLLPGGQSVVQVFWLASLGVLFLDRWPNGRGPAWEAGEAVPWPSPADARAEQLEDAETSGREPAEPPERPASRKRRRKQP